MNLKITYRNGMVREIDTSSYVESHPNFIRDESGSKVAENETLATDFRLRWDLIQRIGLVAELFIWDNNYNAQNQDPVIKAAYNNDYELYLSPYRPAKVLRIIEKKDIDDIIEIVQDGETKIWRDIDNNLINFDNVNRVNKVNANYSMISTAYEYLKEKWTNEDLMAVANLQKIESLLGIAPGRLSKILKEKDRIDRKQRLIEAEQKIEQLQVQERMINGIEDDDSGSVEHDTTDTNSLPQTEARGDDNDTLDSVIGVETSAAPKKNLFKNKKMR